MSSLTSLITAVALALSVAREAGEGRSVMTVMARITATQTPRSTLRRRHQGPGICSRVTVGVTALWPSPGDVTRTGLSWLAGEEAHGIGGDPRGRAVHEGRWEAEPARRALVRHGGGTDPQLTSRIDEVHEVVG